MDAITFRGDRAVTVTNAMIVGDNPRIDVAATAHSRLLDRVEKRGFPVTRVFPTKGSDLEAQMKAAAAEWLNELEL